MMLYGHVTIIVFCFFFSCGPLPSPSVSDKHYKIANIKADRMMSGKLSDTLQRYYYSSLVKDPAQEPSMITSATMEQIPFSLERPSYLEKGPRREMALIDIILAAFRRYEVHPSVYPYYLALAHIESKFKADVVSRVGAVGVYQIIPVTAMHIISAHPDYVAEQMMIFNPTCRHRRKVLYRGAHRSYSLRILRTYADKLKDFKRQQLAESKKELTQNIQAYQEKKISKDSLVAKYGGIEQGYWKRLKKADVRFDPYTNVMLGVYYLEKIRKNHFGRYRCYSPRYRSTARIAKRLCGTFSGVHATLMTAAAYHVGMGAVEDMIARSQSRSLYGYMRNAYRSSRIMYRRNSYYLARLLELSRKYSQLLASHDFDQASMAQLFPGDEESAERLFRRYAVTDKPPSM
jgi:soluble lytic murein transglycosylase-like protein